jgi:hypothetical protein
MAEEAARIAEASSEEMKVSPGNLISYCGWLVGSSDVSNREFGELGSR